MLKNVKLVKVNEKDNYVIIKVNNKYFCVEFDNDNNIVDTYEVEERFLEV